MRSKLKCVTMQLQQFNSVIEKLKREQQDLRISCLKLGTGIKPAFREAAKQVIEILLVYDRLMGDFAREFYFAKYAG